MSRRKVGTIERASLPYIFMGTPQPRNLWDLYWSPIGGEGVGSVTGRLNALRPHMIDLKTAGLSLDAFRRTVAEHDTIVIDSLSSLADVDFSDIEKRTAVWLDEAHMIEPPSWKGRAIDAAVPQARHHAALSDYLLQSRFAGGRSIWQTFKPQGRLTEAEKAARWGYLYGGSGKQAFADQILRYSIRDAVLSASYDPVRQTVGKVPLQWIMQQRKNRDGAPWHKRWLADQFPAVYALHSAVWEAGYTCNGIAP